MTTFLSLALFAACAPSTEGADPAPADGPLYAASVTTVVASLPGADGIARLPDGRVVVSAPRADELHAVDLATGEAVLYSGDVAEPYGLAALPGGDVLVANWRAQNALRVPAEGAPSVFAETDDRFGNVFVDAPTGDVYLPSFNTGLLERVRPDGVREVVSEGEPGKGLHAVAFDDERTLYTGYVNAGEIYRHEADDTRTLLATLPGRLGNLLWLDDRLLATSFDTHRIFTVTREGTVEVWAGRPRPGDADGTGEEARFESPNGLLRDGDTLYVTESGGRIRAVTLARGP